MITRVSVGAAGHSFAARVSPRSAFPVPGLASRQARRILGIRTAMGFDCGVLWARIPPLVLEAALTEPFTSADASLIVARVLGYDENSCVAWYLTTEDDALRALGLAPTAGFTPGAFAATLAARHEGDGFFLLTSGGDSPLPSASVLLGLRVDTPSANEKIPNLTEVFNG